MENGLFRDFPTSLDSLTDTVLEISDNAEITFLPTRNKSRSERENFLLDIQTLLKEIKLLAVARRDATATIEVLQLELEECKQHFEAFQTDARAREDHFFIRLQRTSLDLDIARDLQQKTQEAYMNLRAEFDQLLSYRTHPQTGPASL